MPRSICFVSLTNYAALAATEMNGVPGGAEVQQMHIAHGLRDRGDQVSFITYDHGQQDGVEIDGIRIYKAFDRHAGLPGVRFVYPRWVGLSAAMRRADAQVYFQRTAGAESGQVCAWCRAHGRRFVFSVASDADVDRGLPWLGSWMERTFYRYAIHNAHGVVAQTVRQCRALSSVFGRQSVVIPSCKPIPLPNSNGLTRPMGRPLVLWVGRFIPPKRPGWCLSVAALCPQFDFHMVGAASQDKAFESSLRREAASLANVKMHSPVPYAQMGQFYKDCSVLLCTSATEGFPNTFLEAWSYGRPVVASVDPDGAMATSGAGFLGRTPRELADRLSELLGSDQTWGQAARAADRRIRENHSVDKIVDAYQEFFDSLA